MTTLVNQIWFVVEKDGAIRSSFNAPRPSRRNGGDIFGPYDLTYDAPQEVEDASSAAAAAFQQGQQDRQNRRIRGTVTEP